MTRHAPLLRQQAWWMAPGLGICRFCSAAYHAEIAHHCGGCDRPVFVLCTVVVFEKRIALYPACAAEGES